MEELQSILEAVDAGDFTPLTDEQLSEAAGKITEYGRSLKPAEGVPSDQDITDAKALAAALKAVNAELAVRQEAATTRAKEAEEAFAAFGGDDPAPEPVADPTPDPGIPPVTASRPSAAEVARRRPMSAEPKIDEKPKALVASAGEGEDSLGGIRYKTNEDLAKAMFSTWSGMPDHTGQRAVARIPIDNQIELGMDEQMNGVILASVAKKTQEARNDGIALTAALGCAPSEPVYEFFNQSARGAGLIDLPSVTARRGSRTYPPAVGITNIAGQTGIATLYTGASKSCYTVNCGTTREYVVHANYTCLTFQNEMQFFYPEMVAQYQSLALVAYEHTVNQWLIEAIRDSAITTSVHDLDTLGGTTVGLTRAAARARAYYIERHKMSEDAVLDAIMPYWFRAAYQADIAARQSTDYANGVNLGSGRIDADLRSLGINAQFTYDWQQGPAEGFDDFGSFLLYAPGTFVQIDGPTLDLGVVRDSTLNAANDFQVFYEGWTGLAAVGHQALYVQGVDVCPSGSTGATVTITCGAS